MKQVGIDFGTSTIQIAQRKNATDLTTTALPIGGQGEFSLPSVIAYEKKGSSIIKHYGQIAIDMTPSEACIIIRSIKQALLFSTMPHAKGYAKALMPVDESSDWETRFFDKYTSGSATWEGNTIVFDIFGQQRTSLSIANDLFCGAIENTIQPMQDGYDNAVICCPVDAKLAYRAAMKSFLAQNSLVRESNIIDNVVEEASLAAQAILKTELQRFDAGDLILVYDFGGGTFDAALARVEQRDGTRYLSILCSANDPFLGGDNIDEAIMAYVLSEANIQTGVRREDLSKTDLYRLRLDCKRAKEELSISDRVDNKSVDGIRIKLSHEMLTKIIRPIFTKSISTLNRLSCHYYAFEHSSEGRSQNLKTLLWDNPKLRVICTGGTINMPTFQHYLRDLFGDKMLIEGMLEPEMAVVTGAALADKGISTNNLHHTAYNGYILFKDSNGNLIEEPKWFKTAFDPSSSWHSTIQVGIPNEQWKMTYPSGTSEVGIIFCPAHLSLPHMDHHFWEQGIPENSIAWMRMPPIPVSYEVPSLNIRISLDGLWSMHCLNKHMRGFGPWILGSALEKKMNEEETAQREQSANQLYMLKRWMQTDNLRDA